MVISGGGSICDDGTTTDVIFNTTSGTPTYDIEYSVGIDNEFAPGVGYQHVISTNKAGLYTIKNIEDSKGCIGKNLSGSAQVIVNPMPEINFTTYPQPTDINDPVIYFVDQSVGHVSGVWSFGDEDSLATNFYKVNHTYKDTGSYLVNLMIATDSGCTVLKSQTIIINQAFTLYVPNSFTPNNDLRNDHFLPIVDGVQEYQLSIYDRLGQRIFETTDFTNQYCIEGCGASWDGKINGAFAPSGSYVYAIVVIDVNGKEQTFEGTVVLIR